MSERKGKPHNSTRADEDADGLTCIQSSISTTPPTSIRVKYQGVLLPRMLSRSCVSWLPSACECRHLESDSFSHHTFSGVATRAANTYTRGKSSMLVRRLWKEKIIMGLKSLGTVNPTIYDAPGTHTWPHQVLHQMVCMSSNSSSG